MEEQKIRATEALANSGRPLRSFDEALRTALEFLANPWETLAVRPPRTQKTGTQTRLHRPTWLRSKRGISEPETEWRSLPDSNRCYSLERAVNAVGSFSPFRVRDTLGYELSTAKSSAS
jgi:hypothetical protein